MVVCWGRDRGGRGVIGDGWVGLPRLLGHADHGGRVRFIVLLQARVVVQAMTCVPALFPAR